MTISDWCGHKIGQKGGQLFLKASDNSNEFEVGRIMKKFVILLIIIAIGSFFSACEGHRGLKPITPITINRSILTDAVWQMGDDIPYDAACVAGSTLHFEGDDLNPLTITLDDGSARPLTTRIIITSALYIQLDDYFKGDLCPGGHLYYVVQASKDDPIEIEWDDPYCMFEEHATEEGASIPLVLAVYSHLEAHETVIGADSPIKTFKLVVDYCAFDDSIGVLASTP